MFSNTCREKEDLYRALVNSWTFSEDSKLDLLRSTNCAACGGGGGRETTRERRAKFIEYINNSNEEIEWRNRGEVCNCDHEHMSGSSGVEFVNSFINRMFYDIIKEKFFLDLIHR